MSVQKNNMEKDEIVVGLDIGTTKICTIVGRKNEFGKIEILGYGKYESHGVTRGVVTNIVNTIESITKSVQEASEKSNVDIGSGLCRNCRTAYQKSSASRHAYTRFAR